MSLPHGFDRETMLFLERHETRVHAMPGREVRDLGDALLLHDPLDREPFWNRVSGVRWPDDPASFDRRLAETIALFAVLDRIPHVWPRAAFNEPADLAARLIANGWDDAGGGAVMLLTDPDTAVRAARERASEGVTLERLRQLTGESARRAAADFAAVLAESFEVEAGRQTAMELEALAMWDRPEVDALLVRVAGEPAAAVKRTTFDGASYLSSIGTRPAFRGRGLARLATAVATADALAQDVRWTYLGVFIENEAAVRVYRRLGYETLGDRAPDLILR